MTLRKERTKENYIKDKLSLKSKASKEIFNRAIVLMDEFCIREYKKELEEIIKYLNTLGEDEAEEEIIEVMQNWINKLNNEDHYSFNSIKAYFSSLNKYLRYHRIKVDFDEEIHWPQRLGEEKYSITQEDIDKIFILAKPKKRCLYMCLASSGARPREVIGLCKKHLSKTKNGRYMVKIPSYLTKKKQERTTFFSKDCTPYLDELLKTIDENNLVFAQNKNVGNACINEQTIFRDYRVKAGLDKRYEGTGYGKINLYCFRGFFFTRALKILNEDTAHAFIGHGAYLQDYQRRNDEEKEELYSTLEPHLSIIKH